jgi:PST family polysaccharide transporter
MKINTNVKSFLSNSAWLLFDKFYRIGLGMLVSVWIARYLGPANFGELAYVVSALIFFQTLSRAGLDGILVRELSLNPQNSEEIIGTAFCIKLISGTLSYLLAISLFYCFEGPNLTLLIALAGITLFFQSMDILELWFQSQSQNKKSVIAKLIAYSIVNIGRIFLIITEQSITYFALFVGLEMVFAAFSLAFIYTRKLTLFNWKASKTLTVKLLKESWPYLLSGLSIVLYMRIDQLLIRNLMTSESLGLYAAGVAISAQLSFIPVIIQKTITPFITRKKAESEQQYNQWIKKLFFGYAVFGWLICIPFYFFAEHLIVLLYGEVYRASSEVLAIHIFTNLFINMGIAQTIWMVLEGRGKLALAKTLVGLCVCIICNLILIPQYGIVGAAISAVLAQASQAVLSNIILAPNIFLLQVKSLIFIKAK